VSGPVGISGTGVSPVASPTRPPASAPTAAQVKGELDWIVMKALDKDRTRRYETPNLLAADVQRHLAGEAVVAAPPSAAYRLRKFVRRNKGAVVTVSAVILALAAGGSVAAWQWSVARSAEIARTQQVRELDKAMTAITDAAESVARAGGPGIVEQTDPAHLFPGIKLHDPAKGRWAGFSYTASDNRVSELRDEAIWYINYSGKLSLDRAIQTDAAEWSAYTANLALAQSALAANDYPEARRILERVPKGKVGWEHRFVLANAHSTLFALKGHTSSVDSASFSPDGTRIVTASYDGTVRVWDAARGTTLAELKGHTRGLSSAAFSPDGTRIVTASWDNTARVWDASTGTSLAELKGHTRAVLSAAFSPDGARIVTASQDDTARVWDAATGASVAELKGHTSGVNSAEFSPDGTRIVTASWDQTSRVWDAATGASVAELKGHTGDVNSAAFSPDGTRIVTASLDNTARVWDAIPYRERYPSLAAARAAQSRVAGPLDARINAGEALDAITKSIIANVALSAVDRTASLIIVQRERDLRATLALARAAEAGQLNRQARPVVAASTSSPAAVASALLQAMKAAELEPGDANIINTLGVAQYRAGKHEEALATLTRSTELYTKDGQATQPADVAFIAMAHAKLSELKPGHADLAKIALDQLRELMARPERKDDAEAQGFLREAEALIEPGTKP